MGTLDLGLENRDTVWGGGQNAMPSDLLIISMACSI